MARGEKSHAYTNISGQVANNGKIVFPAPQPICILTTIVNNQLRYNNSIDGKVKKLLNIRKNQKQSHICDD